MFVKKSKIRINFVFLSVVEKETKKKIKIS